jgi:hypothetical protein
VTDGSEIEALETDPIRVKCPTHSGKRISSTYYKELKPDGRRTRDEFKQIVASHQICPDGKR